MTMTFNGTSGLTFPDASTQATAATGFGFKNRLINGQMVISQRNGTSSVTPASGDYIVDRWRYSASQSSKFTAQQNAGSVTLPAGFINYLGVTSSSAYSVGASDYFGIQQRIEGLNIADLGWGTANAQTVTLTFKVYSSLTGTFGGAVQNYNSSRSYPFSYTISSANTWTSISITITGDTSGTWLTTNGIGILLNFGLGVGSTYSGTAGAWAGATYESATGATSVVGTNGATFYITGVQLEKGSTATSFDYRPYGTELALCQRYAYVTSGNLGVFGVGNGTTQVNQRFVMPITMRSSPSVSINTAGSYTVSDDYSADITASSISIIGTSVSSQVCRVNIGGFTGLTNARAYGGLPDGTGTARLLFSAEL